MPPPRLRVLVTGASGFIGRHLCDGLRARGHEVIGAARHRPADAAAGERWLQADARTMQVADWEAVLGGVDVVVNCIGIFRETRSQRFAALHVEAATTLFTACVNAGVPRVVQLSALGADAGAETGFHRSKRAADNFALALPLDAAVAQPSLVFGADGRSGAAFLRLAALPWLPLPGGAGPVQPVHVDDAVAALCALAERGAARLASPRIALVGPQPLGLAAYLQALRRGLGRPPARVLPIPRTAVTLAARLAGRLPGSLLDSDGWRMLQRGNTASAAGITALLGHPPRPAAAFVPRAAAAPLRLQAQLPWLLAVLRLSLAAVWLVTAAVSFGLYPRADSHLLLQRAGVPEAWRPAALYGAAALDALLGLLTLVWPARLRRPLWGVQAALIAAYTAIITVRLPEFWLHPYGPVLKNLPLLAVLWLLWVADDRRRRWTT